MKIKRKIIRIDEDKCNGCGLCIPSCAEGALQIVNGKAKLVAETYCDGLGACLGECPRDALKVVEREADVFDENAVAKSLQTQETERKKNSALAQGCPSAQIRNFAAPKRSPEDEHPSVPADQESALTQWPVQIRLVPATAPFLQGAELLVAADCTPLAYPNFHRDFLQGKAVMVGCPKFDDAQDYIERFAEIFSQAGIRSVEVVTMDVPCCQHLPLIVRKGMELSGKKIGITQVVINARGQVLKRQKIAA